ncbi:alpha-D-ribose 1-methylphosphonate 5-triphosphate diphosphatase [Paenibacillus agaridevorans]|uniref:Alpha-D-ribose 1-methylphosphonate 5-triphosphate diphosphatase n=2 Tax=Paenibacillus agaridevorans TaxID=171404 RepID=A0A2R5EJG2_9BACL|nr:alpha-D-ribose 1-methylphosphonate 5-triphosphate diphosphatase [Paenibacillus agaridevorans]
MLIRDGQLVLADRVIKGSVGIVDGRITDILEEEDRGAGIAPTAASFLDRYPEAEVVDAEGNFVLPGLIDIHCDAIEKEVQPRPNTLFPLEMALMEFERKLPLHGITTMYHSLSLGVGLSLRGDHYLTGMVDLIGRYNERRSMIRNLIHLRFEISHHAGLPIAERYVEEGAIHYLSFMDHSPGSGQYRKPGSFERYVMKNQGVTMDEVQTIVEELAERRKSVDTDRLKKLGELARSRGIGVASHDDDTPEQVNRSYSLGANVSEFPITLETAQYAVTRGMRVCVGAPNIVRGVSHDGNLSASEAIRLGAADIICSDYHPSSLLTAIFKLADEGTADLPAAVRMASLHPAQAMSADSRIGSIERDKSADLIIVGRYEGMPWVTDTIVGGVRVYRSSVRY